MVHFGTLLWDTETIMSYFYHRTSGYYFRIKIPLDIRPSIQIKEIKRSLKTGSLCIAKERAFLISGRLKKFFRLLKGQRLKLTKEKILDIIDQYIQEGLESMEEYVLPRHPLSTQQRINKIEGNEDLHSRFVEDMMHYNYGAVEGTAADLLQKQGIEAETDSHQYRKLCHDMLKARVGLQEVEVARAKGDHESAFPYEKMGLQPPEKKNPDAQAAVAALQPEPETAPNSPQIGDLINEWMKENTKALWKPRTADRYQGHANVLLQVIGAEIPIRTFGHDTMRDTKATLQKLPNRMNSRAIFKGKSVSEIIEINETAGVPVLDVNTVNQYITSLGTFFTWCVQNGYMEKNYADGVKIKTRKTKRPDEIRLAFDSADLLAIFGSKEYREDKFRESYQFWLPVLGLYTGARMNELAQLRLDDIRVVDDIPSLVFQEDGRDKEISIKNAASMRTVPLHPFIVDELNFMEHVQTLKAEGKTRLFTELPFQNNNYGHQASKWFGRYKKACGMESGQKVFHCFRHTLSDNLKQQLITETIIDELTGHAVQGETMGRYGKRYSVEVLYREAVLKLDYKIDLSHLKTSKWCREDWQCRECV